MPGLTQRHRRDPHRIVGRVAEVVDTNGRPRHRDARRPRPPADGSRAHERTWAWLRRSSHEEHRRTGDDNADRATHAPRDAPADTRPPEPRVASLRRPPAHSIRTCPGLRGGALQCPQRSGSMVCLAARYTRNGVVRAGSPAGPRAVPQASPRSWPVSQAPRGRARPEPMRRDPVPLRNPSANARRPHRGTEPEPSRRQRGARAWLPAWTPPRHAARPRAPAR